ncbi:MAG: hypothetical protein IPO27_11020 [Bacteroidetes bacterium]|nr:hypothetical protein [Bacteroidota bacterium]
MKFVKAFLLAFVLPILIYGQNTLWELTKYDWTQINNRQLVVILEQEEQNVIDSIYKWETNDSAMVEFYRSAIADFNDALREKVTELWPLKNAPVRFENRAFIESTPKKERANYMILCGTGCIFEGVRKEYITHMPWNNILRAEMKISREPNFLVLLEIYEMEQLHESTAVPNFSYCTWRYIPRKHDVGMFIQAAFDIWNRLVKDNFELTNNYLYTQVSLSKRALKNKTLLMVKQDMEKPLTDEEIRQVYPFPYKIVSDRFALMEILENEELNKYAVLELQLDANSSFFKVFNLNVWDAATGQLLGTSEKNKQKLTPYTLEQITQSVNGENETLLERGVNKLITK